MLRYLERAGLVVPRRTASGYRVYGLLELNQLRSLKELRRRFGVELKELAFAVRLRKEPELRAAVETWLAGTGLAALDWEQRKHERLLAA
jgi:DNA-binding transcriptional MerR regulator